MERGGWKQQWHYHGGVGTGRRTVYGTSSGAEFPASNSDGHVTGGSDEVRDGNGDGRATDWDGRSDPELCLVTPLYDTELQRSNH